MSKKHRGYLSIHIPEAKGLNGKDFALLPMTGRNLYDPWLEVYIGEKVIMSSVVHSNTTNPKFDVKANIPYCYSEDSITIKIYDSDLLHSKLIGSIKISLLPMDKEWAKNNWLPFDNNKKGEVLVTMQYIPLLQLLSFFSSEPLGEDLYFPSRVGGKMVLFQDAYSVGPYDGSNIKEDIDHNCFQSMYNAMNNARKIIYISGWSIYTSLDLMRTTDKKESLGDLLIRKAEEGVSVLIMIWNEVFSSRLCAELIGTHGHETVRFFQGTKVSCVSMKRSPSSTCGVKEKVIESIYTHHMKFFLVDDELKGLIGYIGGIDMTIGRWDFPGHPLWKTLETFHKDDFYNGFVNVPPESGPREPWHDIHSRVEGKVVYDLLQAFEERWRLQATQLSYKLVEFSEEDIPTNSTTEGLNWNLQIIRTCDSDSCAFKLNSNHLQDFYNHHREVTMERGYVQLIRSAQKFIYIESQYFLGSSYDWGEYSTAAPNTVPAEIAEQIARSIETGKPIRAYIVVPMSPEGDPMSSVPYAYMSDILQWQFLTIQMMYQRIALAIEEAGIDAFPEDYLLILCLGKKISQERAGRAFPEVKILPTSEAGKWRERRRFLIYVHSKMMLTDDARIIVGSANFNERSLAGCRDTELAVAGSQTRTANGNAEIVHDEDIHRFRKSLWDEHTEGESNTHPAYTNPESLQCIQHIRARSAASLLAYMSDSSESLDYRFLKYPINVSKNGKVTVMPDVPKIPDLDLSVQGKRSYIPVNVTT